MSRPEHAIFHGPVPVALGIEQSKTPEGYAAWTLDELPATLPTLAILSKPQGPDVETPEGETTPTYGLVTDGDGFLDTPDTEIIAGGIHLKGPGYAAIARQGRLLQWGFAGTPEEMTEAGRAVFLNALHYVTRFADDPIVGFREAESRDGVATSLALLDIIEPAKRAGYLERTFGAHVPAEASGDEAFRRAWFAAARPYLAYDHESGTFFVDEDAKALGLANDDPLILKRCVADLETGREPERALRVLRRYTAQAFDAPEDWRAWLDANDGKLAFSDVAGYVFRPKTMSAPPPPGGTAPSDPVSFDASAWSRDGNISARVAVRVKPGYHVYAANAKEPSVTKLRLRLPEGSPFTLNDTPVLPEPRGGHVSGHFVADVRMKGTGDAVVLLADYQACTEKYCLPPVSGREVRIALK